TARGQGRLDHQFVAGIRCMLVQLAQTVGVGDGFYVENQCRDHSSASFPTPWDVRARFSLTRASCWIWRTLSRVTPLSLARDSRVAGSSLSSPKRRTMTSRCL